MGNEQVLPRTAAVVTPAPTGREYIHLACRGRTLINGRHFFRIANPHDSASATLCAACGRMADFTQFDWSDTEENIAAYRQRLKSLPPLSPPRNKVLRWLLVLATPVVLGALAELMLRSDPDAERGVGFAFGAMLGFFLGVGIVLIMNRANPIDYRGYR